MILSTEVIYLWDKRGAELEDLLDGLGLTQKAISRMETGERVVADYELVHLARALEVGVLELLGLEP